MKGLGKTGWAAEVEVELLEEGETREDWTSRSPNQTPVTPIVLDVDAAGKLSLNGRSFTPDELRGWLANVVETFGPSDPVILCPNSASPLAALEQVAASAIDSGMTRVYLLADSQLARAYSVRLHGRVHPGHIERSAVSRRVM